jgi:RND family efflux transporter MFP subunit
VSRAVLSFFVLLTAAAAACSRATADAERATTEPAPLTVTVVAATTQPMSRVVTVSGTLTAEDDADVAAEIAGRIVATPVERGSRVAAGAALIQIASTEADAQAAEARANAAQIEARLGLSGGAAFDVERVPEVANARAAVELARADLRRAESLRERQLISRADFDQRSTQTAAAERQYDTARNNAAQQYQQLVAARARIVVAQKAVADTTVRAPFTGVVGERFVSVGDYVNRGTRVASVLRVDPLRVQMTVAEKDVAAMAVGRAVRFTVDAYPGESFTGQIRYISPAVLADTRALTVEAVVPNADGRMRPGFFATALIEQGTPTPRLVVPSSAVRVVNDAARVFVVDGGRALERVVTIGEASGDVTEIVAGLEADERVVASNLTQITDGARVVAR